MSAMNDDSRRGRVVLVGGGPGQDDLLTVRAVREIRAADVVVFDRLAPQAIIGELGPEVQIIDVGKTPYHHPIPQGEINALLVRHALAGRRVVRLKGGDPFVFGRGGEEALACAAAGVEVEVVPGVSSALTAPAAAHIPITHRGVSQGFLVVSGHDEIRADVIAAWPYTVVVLMGMGRLREICTALRQAGKDPATPVAVVQNAWLPEQKVAMGTLETIADVVAREKLRNPATIVMGEVIGVLGGANGSPDGAIGDGDQEQSEDAP